MNRISLSDFLAELPFASPGMWIEVLCRAMAERFFSYAPAGTEEFIFTSGNKLRHPGEVLDRLWQIFLLDADDRVLDPDDFTAEAMCSMGIRMFDPVRWAQLENVELIVPIHLALNGSDENGDNFLSISHRNAGATRGGYETVGSSRRVGERFLPRCDRAIIGQAAQMLNACCRQFFLPRRERFSVPGGENSVGVRLFFAKVDKRSHEITGFGTLFHGDLAPGSYLLTDETLFNVPDVADDENIFYAGYLDFSSGGNLHYLY